jgi:hypothetical protein
MEPDGQAEELGAQKYGRPSIPLIELVRPSGVLVIYHPRRGWKRKLEGVPYGMTPLE